MIRKSGYRFSEEIMLKQGGCPRSVSWSCCMLARLVLGAVTAGAMIVPELAGMMNADEARRFGTGKGFAFTRFDGTRSAGRGLAARGAAGAIHLGGRGAVRPC